MKLLEPPSAAELATSDFKEFCEITQDYFDRVDQEEVVNSITIDDLRAGIWRPYGFVAIHAFEESERDKRQLRVHVWPEVTIEQLDDPEEDHDLAHKHGAHLGGLALRNPYREHQVSTHEPDQTDEPYDSYELRDGVWVPAAARAITVSPLIEYAPGSTHYMTFDAYHATSRTPCPLSITLVIRGGLLGPSGFLQPSGAGRPLTFPPEGPMPEAELAQVWQDLNETRAA